MNAHRPIAPARKLVAAVVGTVATFVTVFGLGMTSWSIVAFGVALLALSVATGMVRVGRRAWVIGVGHVRKISDPPANYAFGRCHMQIMIDTPGLPPRTERLVESRVAVAKWPSLGQALPIKVALDDPRRIRVIWREVPSHDEVAAPADDLPPEFHEPDGSDEILIGQDEPPWAQDGLDDYRQPQNDESAPEHLRDLPDDLRDLPDDLRDLPDDLRDLPDDREPVVVHQRPGEPVVLEGILVDHVTDPLPRRAAPAPRPPVTEYLDAAAETDPDSTVKPIDVPLSTLDPIDVPLDEPIDESLDNRHDDPDVEYEPGRPAGTEADSATPISGVGMTLLVTDLNRSLTFYRDRLGFTEIDSGDGNAVLAHDSTRLVLREVTEAAPINRRLVHVNLEVDDIDRAYERLKEAGVNFTYTPRIVNRGEKLEVWAAAFRDPDGHGIALVQWRDRCPS